MRVNGTACRSTCHHREPLCLSDRPSPTSQRRSLPEGPGLGNMKSIGREPPAFKGTARRAGRLDPAVATDRRVGRSERERNRVDGHGAVYHHRCRINAPAGTRSRAGVLIRRGEDTQSGGMCHCPTVPLSHCPTVSPSRISRTGRAPPVSPLSPSPSCAKGRRAGTQPERERDTPGTDGTAETTGTAETDETVGTGEPVETDGTVGTAGTDEPAGTDETVGTVEAAGSMERLERLERLPRAAISGA